MATQQSVQAVGGGAAVWMLGGRCTVRVPGADSDGRITVPAMAMPARCGPQPQHHLLT